MYLDIKHDDDDDKDVQPSPMFSNTDELVTGGFPVLYEQPTFKDESDNYNIVGSKYCLFQISS